MGVRDWGRKARSLAVWAREGEPSQETGNPAASPGARLIVFGTAVAAVVGSHSEGAKRGPDETGPEAGLQGFTHFPDCQSGPESEGCSGMVERRIANPLVSRVPSAVAAVVVGSHQSGKPGPDGDAAEAGLTQARLPPPTILAAFLLAPLRHFA